MSDTTFIIIFLYSMNICICQIIHIINLTPFPKTFWEWVKLTFLPYVIWNFKNLK